MLKFIFFPIGLCCLLIQQPLQAQMFKPDFLGEMIDEIQIGYGLAIGDVDGDSRPDILLADQKQFVWYRNGDWKRFVMADSLTTHDNVCIAARDINQDGKVEVAVGAQWNPGETSDTATSGAVRYLIRPENPEQLWQPVVLPHEPTVHRMHWVKTAAQVYQLVVLPLHGQGNVNGEGQGARMIAYRFPGNPTESWDTTTVASTMHMTHNFEVMDTLTGPPWLYVAGKEGVVQYALRENKWQAVPLTHQPAGEVRIGKLNIDRPDLFLATIEPIHGNRLMLYQGKDFKNRTILYDDLAEGHALACADLLDLGRDQIVVGWRNPNKENKSGIRIYVPVDDSGEGWMYYAIDETNMACEDLKIADMDGDGDLDIVAAGRSSHNLKIYWNQLKSSSTKVN